VTPATIAVWDVARLRAIWQARNASPVEQDIGWSSDDSVLIHLYFDLGTALLDSSTGAPLARFPLTKPAAFGTQEFVLPSLRYRISSGDAAWEVWPIPGPDQDPPRESLQRVLSEAGLELRGAELLDATPALR